MKNKLITLTFALLVIKTVSSQVTDTTYIVAFERVVNKPYSGILTRVQIVEDYSFLKNIPAIECDISAINSFKLNQIAKDSAISNQMYLFVGINEKKKEKYVVMDANNNHDFSDDKVYTFSLPDEPLTREEKAERAVALRITPDPQKNDTVDIGIDPFNYFSYSYSLPQDERLLVVIVFTEYMQAKTQIKGTPVEIYAANSNNLFQRDLDEKTFFTIYYNDKANKRTHKQFLFGRTFQINDNQYKFSKIEHPNIYLEAMGVLIDSCSIGSFFPAVSAKDINNNNLVSINSLIKDKYVFIDFWGSWCNPCIQSIPKLKDFYEKIKDRPDVLMLGIAYESNNKDAEKLKSIIDGRKIGWLNLWTNSKESLITTSIINKLNIVGYPTYLIIDNTGKIVYKNMNVNNTQEAIDFFMDLIDT